MNLNELQLQELRRFAELGRLSASMLHEISNPLSAALLQLEISEQTSPAIRKAKRNMQLLRRYVEAARQQVRAHSNCKNFSLPPQLDQIKTVLLPMARQGGVRLQFGSLPAGYKLYGDPVKFQQILANLIANAIQSYEPNDPFGQAALVHINFYGDEDWLTIQIIDWGKGIGASELSKVFEPFYTTKHQNGHGLGIGLAIVKQYVTVDFDGSIKVSSSHRLGTRFTIKLRRKTN